MVSKRFIATVVLIIVVLCNRHYLKFPGKTYELTDLKMAAITTSAKHELRELLLNQILKTACCMEINQFYHGNLTK